MINAGAGIRTLVGLRQQVLSLSPLASSGTPAKERQTSMKILNPYNNTQKVQITSENYLKLKNFEKIIECSGRDSNPSLRLERPK